MVNRIPADWIYANARDFNAGMRFYIDPRGIEYPVYSGTPAYSEVSGAYNKPGRYTLTSALTYLLIPSSSISGEVLVENITGGTVESHLIRLLGGYTLTLKHVTGGGYSLSAVGGTTETITGGTTQPLQRVGFVMTYGGILKLYVDGVNVASGTAPALTTNPIKLEINGSANSLISYCRIFDGYAASATDFLTNWKSVGNEEIFFFYNKIAYGKTRCNLNRSSGINVVTAFSIDRDSGYKAATASMSMNNLSGEFSDDQYGTFLPKSGSYNGTSSQQYLTKTVGVEIESWAPSDALYPSTSLYPSASLYPDGGMYTFERVFIGMAKNGSFSRSTKAGGKSIVSISAEDGIATIAKRVVRKSRVWENYYLSRSSPDNNSLFHSVAELATKRETYNYLTNSSFENAAIGNSWLTDGTLIRDTTAVIDGSYCGKFSGISKLFYQTVQFADLSQGEKFTGSIYVYSTSAISGVLTISEKTGSTVNGYGTTSFTHSGTGWEKITCTYSIVNSASTSILFSVTAASWTDVPVDCAMLKYGDDTPHMVVNSNDGASGISAVGSEMSGTYDWIGIDAGDVSYIHPWATVQDGDNIWAIIKQIGDSCIARVLAMDACGVLRFVSNFDDTAQTSLGSIANFDSIDSGQQALVSNSIFVKGCKIVKRTNVEAVWQVEASGLDSDDGTLSGKFSRVVAAAGTIPSVATDGTTEIEAKYGVIVNKYDVQAPLNHDMVN